uniref:Uncharacterized protein n=1 Tax=Chromera velia CCMP2878 TaxID=1169474 RepID=A0A0G4IEE2_9ALVE|eukprot:Cvel_13642.t1-p1 / transcript=Cvel_13642.t1 / gene=Cvel_13642 / organism=Chromera_velia_CCMP2878 / gene_product=hypothetical protein / transcript_product=hypothetical protein / location=Cvel_scaffold940:56091-56549(+) / protein_length=153 / sequence_SO=supercontig / SO=protein_coding / is_pseudo=false
MVLHSLQTDQKQALLNQMRSGGKDIPLDLNALRWEDIKPHLDWFAAIEERESRKGSGEKGPKKDKAAGRKGQKPRQGDNQNRSGGSGQKDRGQYETCRNCGRKHPGVCWTVTKGIKCNDCGEVGHNKGAPACSKVGNSSSSSKGGEGGSQQKD